MTEHRFSQTDIPGAYRCTCGWQGSDYQAHRQETNRTVLRTERGVLRMLHATPRQTEG